MKIDNANSTFEMLVDEYLTTRPDIPHKWETSESSVWGHRKDLICGTSPEVWASLTEVQISIGRAGEHVDFESFGRKISAEQVASEAFEYFKTFLNDVM